MGGSLCPLRNRNKITVSTKRHGLEIISRGKKTGVMSEEDGRKGGEKQQRRKRGEEKDEEEEGEEEAGEGRSRR